MTTASGLQNPHHHHHSLEKSSLPQNKHTNTPILIDFFFVSRYRKMVIHELEMSSRRETQVVEMMRLPPDENGMGCKLDFDAFAEIEKRTTEVILLLHERG